MSFDQSTFAKSLYISGTPRKSAPTGASNFSPSTPQRPISNPSSPRTPVTPPSSHTIGGKSYTPNAYKPSTPNSNSLPTGSWKHPSLGQVRRRTVNKEIVVKRVMINLVVLAVVHYASKWVEVVMYITDDSRYLQYLRYFVLGLQMLCGYNVVSGLYQLIRPPERFDDLPMTPTQRKLLGLPDSPKAASVQNSPSPPKYLKSSPQTRISPRRASPLSKSTNSPSKGSPLSKFSPSPNKPKSQPTAAATTTTNSLASPTPKPINKPTDTPSSPKANVTVASSSSTPFTPTGRYMYMSDSPNRRSSLRRL